MINDHVGIRDTLERVLRFSSQIGRLHECRRDKRGQVTSEFDLGQPPGCRGSGQFCQPSKTDDALDKYASFAFQNRASVTRCCPIVGGLENGIPRKTMNKQIQHQKESRYHEMVVAITLPNPGYYHPSVQRFRQSRRLDPDPESLCSMESVCVFFLSRYSIKR